MKRRFSWCTVVALLVLLFVTTEGLRGQSSQVEDHKTHAITNRGSSRFNPKTIEEATTASVPSSYRSKSTGERFQSRRTSHDQRQNGQSALKSSVDAEGGIKSTNSRLNSRVTRTTEKSSSTIERSNNLQRRSSERQATEPPKVEATINRTNDRKYLPEKNEKRKTRDNDQDIALEAPKESFVSRRGSTRRSVSPVKTKDLDTNGPSVFAGATENTRSRTERKIQTTYSPQELKSQLHSSRRFSNKRSEDIETTTLGSRRKERRNRTRIEKSTERSTSRSIRSKSNVKDSDTAGTRRKQEVVLSGSESVRVDIPLAVAATENPAPTSVPSVTTTTTNAAEIPSTSTQRQSPRVITRRSESSKTSDKESRNVDGTKSRGRSNDSESSNVASRGASRRGSSKFSDSATTESKEQFVSPRSRGEGRNTGSRDRSRNPDAKSGNSANESRSRSRGRSIENAGKNTSNGNSGQVGRRRSSVDRNSSDKRSRTTEVKSKVAGQRGQDQDARARSRSRPKPDVTTIVYDITTMAPSETTVADVTTASSTEPDKMITTTKSVTSPPTSPSPTTLRTTTSRASPTTTEGSSRGRGRGRGENANGRKGTKEDFFNHGLGFRGRKVPSEGLPGPGESRRNGATKTDSQSRGNPGWTLRRRPGHANKVEPTSQTFVPLSRDQTNEIISPNDPVVSTEVSSAAEGVAAGTRRGSKKQQSGENTTVAGTIAKSTRRGNKTFDKAGGLSGGKSALEPESDNYPPEFKARLSQLKNTSSKLPPPKTTSRTTTEEQLMEHFGRRTRTSSKLLETDVDDLEAAASGNVFPTDRTLLTVNTNPLTSINGTETRHAKKSAATLFSERSRMKLELARRLVKPELNVEGNDLEPTTGSSYNKPNPTEIPVVDESRKVAKVTKVSGLKSLGRTGSIAESLQSNEKSTTKLSRSRKDLDESSSPKTVTKSIGPKKGRIISERMVTSISVEESTRGIEGTTRPYESSISAGITVSAEDMSATTIDSTKTHPTDSRDRKKPTDENLTTVKAVKVQAPRNTRVTEKNTSTSTIKPKRYNSYSSRDSSEESNASKPNILSTIKPKKTYAQTRGSKQHADERKATQNTTKKPKLTNSVTKTSFRPRYSKRPKQKSLEDLNEVEYQTTMSSRTSVATSRYTRKKTEIFKPLDSGKVMTTEAPATQTKRREFRPRTATYRRHSEVPTTLAESTTKVDGAGVAITPRSPRYHATVKSSTPTPRSIPQEPQVSLQVSNDTVQQPQGITGSSNGDSGNTNIFSPTRSLILASNATLLDQLRSTVAPLLNSLGNKTPVFAGAYRNVNSGTGGRITPNGSPPRFSARYKGAELFVRKPNIYQATVPSITSSSTTPVTPVENSGSAPPIDVSSPGEPRFLTFYHAVESASIRNEQPQGGSNSLQQVQADRVTQVDSNASVLNGTTGNNNSNNDTTSPDVATASSQTPDTVNTTQSDTTLTPRLAGDTENANPPVTTEAPADLENTPESTSSSSSSISTTEQAITSTDVSVETMTSNDLSNDVQVDSRIENQNNVGESSTMSTTMSQESVDTSTSSTTTTELEEATTPTTTSTTTTVVTTTSGNSVMEFSSSESNQNLESTTSGSENTVAQMDASTVAIQNSETTSTAPQTTTGVSVAENVVPMMETTSSSVETTSASEMSRSSSIVDSSESPETNTIQQSASTSTEGTDSVRLTDAPTTEAVSNNIIDVGTTEVPVTSTLRNRLIDFAQDILSRLQESIGSTIASNQDFTTTISPPTEILNIIPDSTANRSLEALAQLRDTETTARLSMNDGTQPTTAQNVQAELSETTTASSVAMDQPSLRTTTEETTTQNAVGSITSFPTTDEPNSMISTQETDTQDDIESTTTTTTTTTTTITTSTTTTQETQTISSTDSTIADNDRESKALLEVEVAYRNNEISNNTVENFENSSDSPLDTGITTVSMTNSRYTTLETDARTSNDTLLTELMSIAKTLFSEAMNETEQLLPIQSMSSDSPDSAVTTPLTTLDSSTQVENLIENEVDQTTLSNDAPGTTQVAESSSATPDVTTETVQSTPDTVGTTAESVRPITTIDPTENEVESSTRSTTTASSIESSTDESNTTPEPNLVENEVEFLETNRTTSLELGPESENLVSTTQSSASLENEVETSQVPSTMSPSSEIDPSTTTQSQTTTTQTTETTVTTNGNFELTTNTYDLFSPYLIATTEAQTTISTPTTESPDDRTEQTTQSINSTTLTAEPTTESPSNITTNPPFDETTRMVLSVPETILSRVNMFASLESTTASNDSVDVTTIMATTDLPVNVTNDVDNTTNQQVESTTESAPSSSISAVTSNEPLETSTPITTTVSTTSVDAVLMDAPEANTNPSTLTTDTEPSVDQASNSPAITEATTNTFDETTTTNLPQTTPSLMNETPTVVARFQDATSTTAQGTAGSGVAQSEQTTENNIPTITESQTVQSSTESTTNQPPDSSSRISTTMSSSVETTVATTTTQTMTSTSTGRLPDEGQPTTPQTTTQSSRMDVVTVTPVSETTVSTPVAAPDINENLISTEAPADASTMPAMTTSSPDSLNTIPRMDNGDGVTTMDPMASTTPGTNGSAETTTPGMQGTTTSSMDSTTGMPMMTSTTTRPSAALVQTPGTPPYLGRFGGSRITPAPRFSSSSTTKAPLRDYLIYGIYPNKTIVRKRPEDNLIDARNVDSPYVIFGIYPDGRLVRKFPNGTIIPDPPRNPVEVVFSLSTTTTTNRPPPRLYYNQANQGTYNQYQAPAYYNNRRPAAELIGNVQSPGTVDLGLTGNAIVGPNGGGPDFTGPLGIPGSLATTNKMSDVLLNTQMGTTPNVASAIAGLLTPNSGTSAQVRPATDSQGGRIVQDRERDEATRTKEAGGQRSSVYIGQEKFVNYWTDGAPTTNPRVLSVRINSVANAVNEGPLSSGAVPSFDNLLNNQSGGTVTAPPGFPWNDPLDQIFGITTNAPVITASVSSNTLDDPVQSNVPIVARPINPFVEVFTPISSAISSTEETIRSSTTTTTTTVAPTTTTTTTPAPTTTTTTTTTTPRPTTTTTTTTTTTMAPTTTTTTTMAPTTTTTTTMAPTTTTTTTMAPTTTTTMAPTTTTTTTTTTMAPTTTTTTMASTTTSTTTASSSEAPNAAIQEAVTSNVGMVPVTTMPSVVANNILTNMQTQNAFGTTFDDLAFLNSLLQTPNTGNTTPKTLTQVEQLLANKILSLALGNPAQSRAAKAVGPGNASPNSIVQDSPSRPTSEPIVIDLFPSSTATSPTWQSSVTQQQTSQKPVESSLAPDQVTWKPVSSTTVAAKRDTQASTTASTATKTTPISTTKAPVVITAKSVTTPRPRTTTAAPLGFGASLWQALFGPGIFAPPTTQRPVKSAPKQVKTTPKPIEITPKPIQTTRKPVEVAASSEAPSVLPPIPQTVDISQIQVIPPNSISNNEKPVSSTSKPLLNNPNPRVPVATSTYSPEEDAKFLAALLRAVQTTDGRDSTSKTASGAIQDDEQFLRAILSGQAPSQTTSAPSPTALNDAALLAALLQAQGIQPPTPANTIREQLLLASLGQSITSAPSASTSPGPTTTTTRPSTTTARPTVTTKKTVTPRPTSRPRLRTTTWLPSSTYPPPLFSSFANYGTSAQSPAGDNSGNGGLFGATRAFSQFLGAAISGAAQQLQSFVRNGTRIVTEAVG